jgi:molecular chaperone GrpE
MNNEAINNKDNIDSEKINEEKESIEKNNTETGFSEKNLKDKIEETPEIKIKELEEKIARTLAEMENQRRRYEKEKDDAFEFGGFNFAKECLSLIDNLDRAKISISNDETFKNNKDLPKILENFEIIQKDLISVFKKNKIEKIDCLNKKFDPNFHQAMLEIENSEKEPGLIVDEMQKGFTMGERLLRPSLVSVTKKIDIKDNEDKNKPKSTEKHEENDKKNKQSNL